MPWDPDFWARYVERREAKNVKKGDFQLYRDHQPRLFKFCMYNSSMHHLRVDRH